MTKTEKQQKRKRLGRILGALFLVLMFLGPGPGLRLINPDPTDPNAILTFLGLPKVYAWGLLCYALQLTIILIAYFKVWVIEDEGEATPHQAGKTEVADV